MIIDGRTRPLLMVILMGLILLAAGIYTMFSIFTRSAPVDKTDSKTVDVIEGRLEVLATIVVGDTVLRPVMSDGNLSLERSATPALTLVANDGTNYSLCLMPDYKYKDLTGTCPPNSNGQMDVVCLGSGWYRCKGVRKSIEQVREEKRKTGKKTFTMVMGTNAFFEVYEIELLEVKEE